MPNLHPVPRGARRGVRAVFVAAPQRLRRRRTGKCIDCVDTLRDSGVDETTQGVEGAGERGHVLHLLGNAQEEAGGSEWAFGQAVLTSVAANIHGTRAAHEGRKAFANGVDLGPCFWSIPHVCDYELVKRIRTRGALLSPAIALLHLGRGGRCELHGAGSGRESRSAPSVLLVAVVLELQPPPSLMVVIVPLTPI